MGYIIKKKPDLERALSGARKDILLPEIAKTKEKSYESQNEKRSGVKQKKEQGEGCRRGVKGGKMMELKGIGLFGLRLTKGLTKGIILPLEERELKV